MELSLSIWRWGTAGENQGFDIIHFPSIPPPSHTSAAIALSMECRLVSVI